LLGQIIWKMRRTLGTARKNYHIIPFRLLSFADGWIFINLTLAILISIPAINLYTHGTHITVAHAMGATIGINTMLLLGVVFFIIRDSRPRLMLNKGGVTGFAIILTNISLLVFFLSLIGMGFVKIYGQLHQGSFALIMEESLPWFRAFTFSGVFVLLGLTMLGINAIRLLTRKTAGTRKAEIPEKEEWQVLERLN
jgi:nitric oxide reductase subunit B